jgi:hypothetical protein
MCELAVNCEYMMEEIKGLSELRLESSEEYGHYAYQKEYIRNEKKGGMIFINEDLMKR